MLVEVEEEEGEVGEMGFEGCRGSPLSKGLEEEEVLNRR